MSIEMLHCFPHDDRAFRACAEALLSGGLRDPRDLQEQLRRSYPKAVVRRQHPLGALGDSERLWYVYRDGHYVTPADERLIAPVDAA